MSKKTKAQLAKEKKYRLPNGKVTKNIALYAAEWKREAEFLENFLPDWKVRDMDPDVVYSTPHGDITLPVGAIQQITKAILANAKDENEFVVGRLRKVLADVAWK